MGVLVSFLCCEQQYWILYCRCVVHGEYGVQQYSVWVPCFKKEKLKESVAAVLAADTLPTSPSSILSTCLYARRTQPPRSRQAAATAPTHSRVYTQQQQHQHSSSSIYMVIIWSKRTNRRMFVIRMYTTIILLASAVNDTIYIHLQSQLVMLKLIRACCVGRPVKFCVNQTESFFFCRLSQTKNDIPNNKLTRNPPHDLHLSTETSGVDFWGRLGVAGWGRLALSTGRLSLEKICLGPHEV